MKQSSFPATQPLEATDGSFPKQQYASLPRLGTYRHLQQETLNMTFIHPNELPSLYM